MRILNSLSDLNIIRILRLIWLKKKVSRVEIASALKMDKSTVTKIIAELTKNNLVRETDSGTSGPQGGRKPVFLEINGSFACAAGIEINPERIFISLEDLQGSILFQQMKPIDPANYAEKGFMGLLQEGIDVLQKNAKRLHIKIAGYGLGVPGMVDVESGKIIQSIPLLIEDSLDVTKKIQPYINKKLFFVENDARCCCYTEQILTNGVSAKNMMFIMAEYRHLQPVEKAPQNLSVGLGLILNGKIYHGANSTAGEFRSMQWECPSKTQFSLEEQSLESTEIREKLFRELAKNIAFLVNTLSLDVVYVGGIEKQFAEEIVKFIREEIVYLWPYAWNKTTVVSTASVSQKAVSYGAGTMVLDKIFSVPELESNSHRRKTPPISPYTYLLTLEDSPKE